MSELVKVLDAASGQELMALAGHTESVTGVAWSPDSNRLASGAHDGTVRFWDAANGDELFSFKVEGVKFGSIALSPDGNRLAAADESHGDQSRTGPRRNDPIRVWDVAKLEELFSIDVNYKGHSIAYSPDGSRLACGAWDFEVFDAATGTQIQHEIISRSINRISEVVGVAFSPDGSRVVGACTNGVVRVWGIAR